MLKSFRMACCFSLVLFLAGCSSTITNLTPRQHVRSPEAVYPIEASFATSQRSLRKDTVQPYVVVGMETFPMQKTEKTLNRWEASIPVPAQKRFLNYRFKFDYEYDAIPQPRKGSKLSRDFQLEILDR